jgi:hypothetical protein
MKMETCSRYQQQPRNKYSITLEQLVLSKDPSQLEACEREAPNSSFFSVFQPPLVTGNIEMAFTNWQQQK